MKVRVTIQVGARLSGKTPHQGQSIAGPHVHLDALESHSLDKKIHSRLAVMAT